MTSGKPGQIGRSRHRLVVVLMLGSAIGAWTIAASPRQVSEGLVAGNAVATPSWPMTGIACAESRFSWLTQINSRGREQSRSICVPAATVLH